MTEALMPVAPPSNIMTTYLPMSRVGMMKENQAQNRSGLFNIKN